MSLRAIIIDDEQKGIDAVKILIDKYIPEVKVIADSAKASAGIEMIENYKPDIVFLDINMPEMTGFELLEKLSWKNFNLVFTTAHQEYALKALKNNAIDYLLKPIDHNDLRDTVKRIQQKTLSAENGSGDKFNYQDLLTSLKETSKNKILIHSKAGIESIDTNDIVVLESVSNYTHLHLSNAREIVSSKTMRDFETLLCKNNGNFMRVHHSYIINLHKVVRYIKSSEDLIMNNDQKVPIAKSKKDDFVKWLNL